MKKTLETLAAVGLAAIFQFSVHAQAQAQAQTTHKLTKLWESEATLKVPEGVRLDAKRKVLYVSNIDGQPWEADGKGSIAKVGLDGKVIAAEWITGLDCPKGLALSADGKWLYAADAGGIVVIDIKAGKIRNKIAIPDGMQLNDLASDGKDTWGAIGVSENVVEASWEALVDSLEAGMLPGRVDHSRAVAP